MFNGNTSLFPLQLQENVQENIPRFLAELNTFKWSGNAQISTLVRSTVGLYGSTNTVARQNFFSRNEISDTSHRTTRLINSSAVGSFPISMPDFGSLWRASNLVFLCSFPFVNGEFRKNSDLRSFFERKAAT